MQRKYYSEITHHLQEWRQMVFLAGPRQVGKTTLCLMLEAESSNLFYLNWDDQDTRKLILSGIHEIAKKLDLLEMKRSKPIIIFDEIHKWSRWKLFLKAFFDLYGDLCRIVVTGSAKLNIYKRKGDSLMGRYFLYRIHPLTVSEIVNPKLSKQLLLKPRKISEKQFNNLFNFGGFPEPFLKANPRFSSKWQASRLDQLIREDIRDLSQIQELASLEMLAHTLKDQAGSLSRASNLANLIQVSSPTIKRWLSTLEAFYYSFSLHPWSKNVRRSLRKEPKYFLWDWSLVKDRGSRCENFVASHLLKAVHFWSDMGFGEFDLHYIRDKEKREVDFLVTRDGTPWFLVEVKSGNNKGISKSLYYFQEKLKVPHTFQVSFELEYVNQDCFAYDRPVIVPVTTFLSQLV